MNYLYIAIAIIAGGLFALQPLINSNLARSLNSPILASLVSFLVGTSLLTAINLAIGINLPYTSKMPVLPWWMWLSGGAIGAFIVTVALVIQPKIGAGGWIACYILGQLTMSVLIDNYGLLNLEIRPLNLMRVAGIFLLTIGAILVARY